LLPLHIFNFLLTPLIGSLLVKFFKFIKVFQQQMRLLKIFLLFKLILFVCLSDCAQDDKAESSGANKDGRPLIPQRSSI